MAGIDFLTYFHRPVLVSLCIFLGVMHTSKFIMHYFYNLNLYALLDP